MKENLENFQEKEDNKVLENQVKETKEVDINEPEMGFWQHLEELRNRIIYGFIALIIGCIISAYYIEPIMNYVLLLPAQKSGLELQNLKVFGKPMLYFKVIVLSGFIISMPYLLFQIWKFIEPALYKNEKSWARKITFFTTFCFLCGISFAYFVMIPSMLSFSASFGAGDNIKNTIDINEYWSFLMLMIITAGIFFEMPMISFILSRIGLLTPILLRKYWRHSAIIILILAAILTPSPDPFNQLIVAVPIYILYEISIIVSKFASKKYMND